MISIEFLIKLGKWKNTQKNNLRQNCSQGILSDWRDGFDEEAGGVSTSLSRLSPAPKINVKLTANTVPLFSVFDQERKEIFSSMRDFPQGENLAEIKIFT